MTAHHPTDPNDPYPEPPSGQLPRPAWTLICCGVGQCADDAHDFKGWREFDDGRGGETVCAKCGMGAMAFSLRAGL